MEPTWQTADGSVQLYLGDCLDILPQLADGSVDAVVTDIPYGAVNRASGGLRNLDKGSADVVSFCVRQLAAHVSRVAMSCYVFCGTEQVSELRRTLVDAGMTTRLCIWEKSNPSPMNGQRLWLSSIEACVFGRWSLAYFAPHCESCVWRGPIERDQEHPTQKPLWLMAKIVAASVPDCGCACDPFMGSGTTGVACVRTGRKFIGIEIEPKYFEIAVKRIEAELNRAPLFDPAPQVVQRSLLDEPT